MGTAELYQVIKETVSLYIKNDFSDETNLLGITPVRNIIYILTDLEEKLNLNINDSFISDIKNLSIEILTRLIPDYLN